MGNWVCKRAQPSRVLLMGLDAAGKTTILYKLKLGEVVTTIPTIGFNVETVNIDGFEINCWDVGGRSKIRPLYRHYLANTNGVVYVIDSKDHERLEESLDELLRFYFMEEETKDFVFMVLANKQDLEGAMSPLVIEEALMKKLGRELRNQTIFVCPVSATEGDGLVEAFKCFVEQIELKKNNAARKGFISVDLDKGKKDTSINSDTVLKDRGLTKKLIKNPMKYLKSLLFY